MMENKQPLLEVNNLTIKYSTDEGELTAVSDATFDIYEGENFGLVGESGCGKSTLAAAIYDGLDDNGYIASGSIRLDGEEVRSTSLDRIPKGKRWQEISWIPQSSMNTLDPLMKISTQAKKIAQAHTKMSGNDVENMLFELFEVLGLPKERIHDYPHEFSGGMQQRAMIALSLLLEPSLLVADEPTTALDVIIQDGIMNHLEQLRREMMSMLLITHDISLVFETCDRMAVMHGGQIAEVGTVEDIYTSSRHPYPLLLQESFPNIEEPDRELTVIEGKPPQTFGEVNYCTFVNRCPWAVSECNQSSPPLESVGSSQSGHKASCFRKDEIYKLHREESGPAK